MIRDFSKEELEPVATSSDTELTLGGGTLLVLACGLLMLCGVCFGLGYVVGHRNSVIQTAVLPVPVSKPGIAPLASAVKPGAAEIAPPPPRVSADNQSSQPTEISDPAPAPQSGAGQASTQPQVKPALDSQVRPAFAVVSGTGDRAAVKVQPATAKVQGWMVQIAAVSHTEDAQVLIDALRKRGYEVTARRDLADNMIHVQTGPFVNRSDANVMRQKLLNDGYNAIVQ
jgi:DedD protein